MHLNLKVLLQWDPWMILWVWLSLFYHCNLVLLLQAASVAPQDISLVTVSWIPAAWWDKEMGLGCRAPVPCSFWHNLGCASAEINTMEMSSLHHHEGEAGIKFQQSMLAVTEIDTRSLCYFKAWSCLQLRLYQKFLPLCLCQRLLNYFIFVAFEQLDLSAHIL